MKAAERISHVDSKKMKIEIRSAQRGKITKNQHHKDTGIYGGK